MKSFILWYAASYSFNFDWLSFLVHLNYMRFFSLRINLLAVFSLGLFRKLSWIRAIDNTLN